MSSTSTPAKPKMPMKKRLVLAAVVTVIVLVPSFIMLGVIYLATGEIQAAASWASIPAVAGMAVVVAGGRRFAVNAAIVMGLGAPLVIVAGLSPVSGAAAMALMALTVGRLSLFGLHRSALLVPVMMAWPLIDPPSWSGQPVDRVDTSYLLWMALIFLVGGLFPALIGPLLLRKRKLPKPQPHPRSEAVPYTVMITLLVMVATYYVLSNPKMYGGAFLIAAILVLAPIGGAETVRPTIVRVVATVAGSVLVIALVSQVESLAMVYLVGLVLIFIAVVAKLGGTAWIYYLLMVPSTACLNATSLTQVGQLGEQRVIDNVVGGALVLIASAVTIAYSNWATKHGHAIDEDLEVTHLIQLQQPETAAAA